jgi:hypothetical protein
MAGKRLCALTQNQHNDFWQDEHQCVAGESSASHPFPHALLLDTTDARANAPGTEPPAGGSGGGDICEASFVSPQSSDITSWTGFLIFLSQRLRPWQRRWGGSSDRRYLRSYFCFAAWMQFKYPRFCILSRFLMFFFPSFFLFGNEELLCVQKGCSSMSSPLRRCRRLHGAMERSLPAT